MKRFDIPKMTLVHLTKEDVIYTSCASAFDEICPSGHTCYGYQCDDCGTCVGTYYCEIFDK